MNLPEISTKYTVRKLAPEDAEQILALELENPMYFEFCPPAPTIGSVLEDMEALPPRKTYDDKFYIGFFQGEELISVMDLILRYPNEDTAFIGFFMMNKAFQGKGVGSDIVKETFKQLKEEGFTHVRLGFMKGNEQSRHFWLKNGFSPTGVETDNGQGIVVVMQKDI